MKPILDWSNSLQQSFNQSTWLRQGTISHTVCVTRDCNVVLHRICVAQFSGTAWQYCTLKGGEVVKVIPRLLIRVKTLLDIQQFCTLDLFQQCVITNTYNNDPHTAAQQFWHNVLWAKGSLIQIKTTGTNVGLSDGYRMYDKYSKVGRYRQRFRNKTTLMNCSGYSSGPSLEVP